MPRGLKHLHGSDAAVAVSQSDDVVLFEVACNVDFTQHQIVFTCDGEAVFWATEHVVVLPWQGLVFGVARLHAAVALNSRPVLGTVVVVLQGEALALWFVVIKADFVAAVGALLCLEGGIGAPGTMHHGTGRTWSRGGDAP